MKIVWIFLAVVMCLLTSACGDKYSSNLYDRGVSKELAVDRKQSIKNLRYALSFNIPDQKQTRIEGDVKVSFSVDTAKEIVIDFCQSEGKVNHVEVNDKTVDYALYNDHIIISSDDISAGDNSVDISFVASDQSLNRNDEFLYTLLVPDRARTLFPCFDQPDMKAIYSLSLSIPQSWSAVANSPVVSEENKDGSKRIEFADTEPLSTYLFSFVAGKLQKVVHDDGKRTLTAYHRETDPSRIAQLDLIFKQVSYSIDWLEEYTTIKYPFAKYDFIILPGFQYGGMEHTGATLYNDTRMFLGEHPTPDEELQRIQLIAHETAHMWFGDYVTMKWFDDVWTKEVFANYFATKIAEPMFKDINHRLNWLKMTTIPSLNEDRTIGTNAIKQNLDNMKNAGLLYGNIIYCKAPVMMEKLVELMGEEPFRNGIIEYLKRYAYANASWEDLIEILDSHCDADLRNFSDAWVNREGMPEIQFIREEDCLHITQQSNQGDSTIWSQRFNIALVGDNRSETREVNLSDRALEMEIPSWVEYVIPNVDGRGYAHFIPDKVSGQIIRNSLTAIEDETTRMAVLIMLHENYMYSLIDDAKWIEILIEAISKETNPLIASTICSYLSEPMLAVDGEEYEKSLYEISTNHQLKSCRVQLMRLLYTHGYSQYIVEKMYDEWSQQKNILLSEPDYMTMAYELALRIPTRSKQILATQRERIKNPDRLRQFDFISRAIDPDSLKRDALFESLLEAENREIEPWTATVLSYLNHRLYQPYSVKYIRPALDEMVEIQSTGDIFFPRDWSIALLKNYRSKEARKEVEQFLEDNPDYPVLLKKKILQAASPLIRKSAEQ